MPAFPLRVLGPALAVALAGVVVPGTARAAEPPVLLSAHWSLRVSAGAPAGFIVRAVDRDRDAVTVTWLFDDGTTATGERAAKVWTEPGTHLARVTATDATGLSVVHDFTIEVLPAVPGAAPLGPPPAGVRLPRPGPAPVAEASIDATALRLTSEGSIAVRLRCAPMADCAGTVSIARGGRRLGAAPYELRAGRRATLSVRLPPTVARGLRRRHAGAVAVLLTIAPDSRPATRTALTLRTR